MNVVIIENVIQSLLRVSCSTLTIEQGYDDEYRLPPIIEQQRRTTKIFQIFFRTRDALIDTVVAQSFNDDEAATPPSSLPPSTTLDPITPDPKMASSKYQNLFKTIFYAFISYRILLLQCSKRNF